jgi:hypothetical protein
MYEYVSVSHETQGYSHFMYPLVYLIMCYRVSEAKYVLCVQKIQQQTEC